MKSKYNIGRIAEQVKALGGAIPRTGVFSVTAQHHAKRFADTLNLNFYNSVSKHDFDEEIICYVGMFPNEIAHLMRMGFRDVKIMAMFIGSDVLLLNSLKSLKDEKNMEYCKKYIDILNQDNVSVVPVFDNLATELEYMGIGTDAVVTLVPPKKGKYKESPVGSRVGVYLPDGRNKAISLFNWGAVLPLIKDSRVEFSILSNPGMFTGFGLEKLENCEHYDDFDKWIKTIDVNIRITDHDGYPQSVVAAAREGIPTITSNSSAHFNMSPDQYYVVNISSEGKKRNPTEIKIDLLDRVYSRKEYYNKIHWGAIKKLYREGYFSPDRMAYDFKDAAEQLIGR